MAGLFKDDQGGKKVDKIAADLESANKKIAELEKERESLFKMIESLQKQINSLRLQSDAVLAKKVESDLNTFNFEIQKMRHEIIERSREINEKINDVKTHSELSTEELETSVNNALQQVNELERDVKTLSSTVEAQSETVKNQIEFYSNFFSDNFTSIFGERFIAETRDSFMQQVKPQVEEIVLAASGDYLRNALTEYLRESIRHEVVVGLAGNKEIGKDALEAIVDTVTQNVVGEIIKELQDPQSTMGSNGTFTVGGQNGEVKMTSLRAPDPEPFDPKKEHTHEEFPALLGLLEVGLNVYLKGPAGTGKSTAAEQAARALGLPYYSANKITQEYQLQGYKDNFSIFQTTEFIEAYTHGGVFLFDEFDASEEDAVTAFNNGLALGYMSIPNLGRIYKHKDFKAIAAGNTDGRGATAEYTGRRTLDAATLNRFVVLEWGYDRELEKKLCKDKDLLQFCWDLRSICKQNHLNIIIGTRDIILVQKALSAKNIDLPKAIKVALLEGVKIDTIKTIKGGLMSVKGYRENDKYIKALDTIVERDYAKQEDMSM